MPHLAWMGISVRVEMKNYYLKCLRMPTVESLGRFGKTLWQAIARLGRESAVFQAPDLLNPHGGNTSLDGDDDFGKKKA